MPVRAVRIRAASASSSAASAISRACILSGSSAQRGITWKCTCGTVWPAAAPLNWPMKSPSGSSVRRSASATRFVIFIASAAAASDSS